MPRKNSLAGNDAAIFGRLIEAEDPEWIPEVARFFLDLHFRPADRERMHDLSQKAQQGRLTQDERFEVESYERVGHFLSILKSRARKSLRSTREASF